MKIFPVILGACLLFQGEGDSLGYSQWLGIRYASLKSIPLDRQKVSAKAGVLVKEVLDRGLARQAGLLVGDIIVSVDDAVIRNRDDLYEFLSGIETDALHTFHVLRRQGNEYERAVVAVGTPPKQAAEPPMPPAADHEAGVGPAFSSISLKGLGEIDVLVDELTVDLMDAGLSRTELQSEVQRILRTADIPVRRNADAYLYIQLSGFEHRDQDRKGTGEYSYAIDASLRQTVRLARDQKIVVLGAATWQGTGKMGTRLKESLKQDIADIVREMTSHFVTAYLEANARE